jgi:WD40 repeat protein
VHAFDAASGATKWTYDLSDYQEYNAFHSIDLSPDGKAVAVGSADHRIHILDVADGSVIRRIEPWEGHTKIVKAVAYSRDGKWLASAGEDQTILTWNTSGYTRGASLVGHVGSVGGLAWSADGGVLLSTSEDTTLRAWNVLRPFERSYEICDFGPWQTPLTADGRFFAAACSDKRLAIYDAATGTVRDSLGAQSGLAAVFSGDSKRLITASFDGIVRAWDVEAGKELRTFEGHTARVDGVAFLNSADNALSVGDSTLRVWSLSSGAAVATVKFQNAPFRVVLPPDERVAYVGFNDGEVKVIDTRTWGETGSFRCGAGIQEMAVSPDGGMLAVFSGRNIEVWATKSLGRIHLLQGHERSGYGIGFSPDGRHIVSGSNDQTFRIWDLSDGSCTLTYHGYEDTIYSCKFLGGRELLLTSSQGKVWYYRF